MGIIFITLQVFLVLILIMLVFVQKSSDEGIANLVSSNDNVSRNKSVNFIVKFTIFIAAAFMVNSLILAKIDKLRFDESKDIIDEAEKEEILAKIPSDSNDFEEIPLHGQNDIQSKEKHVDGIAKLPKK